LEAEVVKGKSPFLGMMIPSAFAGMLQPLAGRLHLQSYDYEWKEDLDEAAARTDATACSGAGLLHGWKIYSAPDGNMPLCRKGLFNETCHSGVAEARKWRNAHSLPIPYYYY